MKESIAQVEETVEMDKNPKIKKDENAKEILKDPKFIKQKRVRSIVDQEARVGHKSKTSNFYVYKSE